ncbi:dTDP-4-amino-4,6-dideoxyglucose formyltransferase [Christiangramia sabulilitoris]|uniref:dTDP-4-amino-4,6-dideoxyglucose formyltransferase n=1 Tax=Christiangramia sabulilitoris TaxID=2583991 RepID=A0A550I2B1_9FLAO|nr:dTDP-4-amino-4,6-dideoxyglucose formyltransferase [Christiangramia sabulilitoris]TRO65115.1 dTDP-4-amino-4,6-dideoxyglucose formyltransferase [Christiangramia sabulilitoris]
MKNILVIIDNRVQYDRMQKIILQKNRNDLNFEFKHSSIKTAIWDHEDFLNKDSIINVNDHKEEIIKNYDLVISVHCYQFFPKRIVDNIRSINIHPGYNPINRGWYPQVFAIVNNLEIGATIHEMDEKLDNGPIICRMLVEKYPWDTSLDIYNRVLEAEMQLFYTYFDQIFDNTYEKIVPEGRGNFYSKKDFYKLCEINLNENATYGQVINRLRALTHGEYQNAFFQEDGKKIFLNLTLTPDE